MGKSTGQSKHKEFRTRNIRVLYPSDPRFLVINGHSAIPFEQILDDKLVSLSITNPHRSREPRWMAI